MAVAWGPGDWPGVTCERLLSGDLTPVCSPDVLDGPHPLKRPSDLKHHVLLHEETTDHWAQWLEVAGAVGVDPRRGPIIDDTNVRIEAAIDGQGVTLGWLPALDEDFAAGRLVRPFDFVLEGFACFLVYPKGGLRRPNVKAFRDWLLAEFESNPALGVD
jgi:LysR family glycine cleavage system transcriptional activator